MSVSAFGLKTQRCFIPTICEGIIQDYKSSKERSSKCKSPWEWNKKRHNGSLWVLDTSAHCDDTVDHVKEAVIHIYHRKERYNIEDNLQNKTTCAEQNFRASLYPESTQKWFRPEATRSPHVTTKKALITTTNLEQMEEIKKTQRQFTAAAPNRHCSWWVSFEQDQPRQEINFLTPQHFNYTLSIICLQHWICSFIPHSFMK